MSDYPEPATTMGDTILRIECIDNGYVVCAKDPKIVKANKKPGRYNDPWCEYAFPTIEKALKWIKEHIDDLEPEEDEYASSFEKAVDEDGDD